MNVSDYIRTIPDFPKPGIQFRDVTTLFGNPHGLRYAANELIMLARDKGIDKVAGIDARGFIMGGILAQALGVGFVPIRKKGKLSYHVHRAEYALEYGTDSIEIHQDAIEKGEKVLLHDDLLATGGTALAATRLIEQCGGEIMQISFIVELPALKGREKLSSYDVRSLIVFEGE